MEFQHAGLPCLLVRHARLGQWCGYAAVPPTHPLHGCSYDDVDVSVHGGLTYANACRGLICHVPKPGEPDNVWWFGFDCAHLWDLAPGMDATTRALGFERDRDDVYRDLAYVRGQTERLAEQLSQLSPEEGVNGDRTR